MNILKLDKLFKIEYLESFKGNTYYSLQAVLYDFKDLNSAVNTIINMLYYNRNKFNFFQKKGIVDVFNINTETFNSQYNHKIGSKFGFLNIDEPCFILNGIKLYYEFNKNLIILNLYYVIL